MSSIRYIDIRTNPSYKYDVVLDDINHNFSSITGSLTAITGSYLSLSGGTVTGNTYFTQTLTASTLDGQTLLSGGTDLYSIFLTSAPASDVTRVQPGTNIITGGTGNLPIISLSDDIVISSLSASTISGNTFYSAGTNLDTVIRSLNIISAATDANSSTFNGIDNTAVMYYDPITGLWTVDQHVNSESTVIQAKSLSGTIAKGAPVYITGIDSDEIQVMATSASASTQMPCVGIASEELTATGGVDLRHVVTFGKLEGIDTSSYTLGDNLYVSKVTGGLTATRPTENGTVQIQRIAKVLKVHATGGQLFVFNSSRTAGLPNLSEGYLIIGDENSYPVERSINELGIVTGTGASNYVVKWDGSGSGITDSIMFESGSYIGAPQMSATTMSADTIYITNDIELSGNFSGGTGGAIYSGGTDLYNIFASAGSNTNLANTNLTLDAARIHQLNGNDLSFSGTGNVGIGDTTPTAKLTLQGDGDTSSTSALIVQDSGATTLMIIEDGGDVGIGTNAPGAKLDVRGGALFNLDNATNGDFRVDTVDIDGILNIDASTNRMHIGAAGGGYFLNVKNQSTLGTSIMAYNDSNSHLTLTLLTSGNSVQHRFRNSGTIDLNQVGGVTNIGNISSSSQLNVDSTLQVANAAGNASEIISSTGGAAFLTIQTNTNNFDPTVSFRNTGTTQFSLGVDSSAAKFMIGKTSVTDGNLIVIDRVTTNVGIGIASPSSQLHVLGDTDVTGGGVIMSASTDLYNIFLTGSGAGVTGSGTDNTVPLWNGTGALDDSILTQQGTSGMTVSGNVIVTGDIEILGSATTIFTEDLFVEDNTIHLNSGGTHTSAIGGGIVVEDGVADGTNTEFLTDSSGNWIANAGLVVNEDALTTGDFRVESASHPFMLFVDASANRFGIGANPTAGFVDITNQSANGTIIRAWNDGASAYALRMYSSAGTVQSSFRNSGRVDLAQTGGVTYMGDQSSNYLLQSTQITTQFSNTAAFAGFHSNRDGVGIAMRGSSANGNSYIDSTGRMIFNTEWNNNPQSNIGTIAMTIDTNQSVGIGLSSTLQNADARLEVIGLRDDSAGYTFMTRDSGDTATFVVEDGGDVGIGIASPTSKLHVVGDTDVTGGGVIMSASTDLYNIFLTGSGAGVTGSGTDNTVPLWNGTGALDDSIITQQGTSALTITGSIDVRGSAIFNEDGGDFDFKIEGDTDPTLFVTDASENNIGVGRAAVANVKMYIDSTNESNFNSILTVGSNVTPVGIAINTTSTSTTTYGLNSSAGGSQSAYAVFGTATGNGPTRSRGVYGRAGNATIDNYAGFFQTIGVGGSGFNAALFAGESSTAVLKRGIYVTNSGGGTGTTTNYGVQVLNASGTDDTINYGFHAKTSSSSSRTGLTNYALYIDTSVAIGDGNLNYGLVVNSTNDYSGFGTTAPSATVDIVGDLELNGDFSGGTGGGVIYSGGTDLYDIFSSTSGTVSKYAGDSAFTTSVALQVDHNIGSTDVIVQLKDASGKLVIPDTVDNYQTNSVDVMVRTTATFRVIITG